MYKFDNDTGGNQKLEFFNNPWFGMVYELDNDYGGFGEPLFVGQCEPLKLLVVRVKVCSTIKKI